MIFLLLSSLNIVIFLW